MAKITLSYVLTTFNKSNYIKIVLPELIRNRKNDEEIIVIDGGSTDGTSEFLSELMRTNKIDYFISEKDKGEAHGFNKGLLLAKGDLIKILTDDDAFYYPVIQECKKYMLLHPEIDVIAGNTAGMDISNKLSLFWDEDFYLDFLNWKEGKMKRFFFNGTCLMLRRSSLPLLGLVDTSVIRTDLEYSLRVSGVANLAWCTGLISVRILNPQSNTLVYDYTRVDEVDRICGYYNYFEEKNKIKHMNQPPLIKGTLKRILRKIRNITNREPENMPFPVPFNSFNEAHEYCQKWLKEHLLNQSISFLSK